VWKNLRSEWSINKMDNRHVGFKLLQETVGISIEIISNKFNEISTNTHHKIVFQINEDEPDIFAIGILK
jgi:hypothetical protein